MTPEEFKKKWDSSSNGGGITNEDCADCAMKWGLCESPKTKPIDYIIYLVTDYANTKDKNYWKEKYLGNEEEENKVKEGMRAMELEFRDLKANEIDLRIAQVKENGLSLLLYKDARVDMDILDETVGAMNWKREHCRDNANCIVSIWDEEKKQWISKEDTGTESFSEAAKGLASDSFKRACFNWGIGRELYTAPFVWIPADKCNIAQYNGKFTCKDSFIVEKIKIENKQITGLAVINKKTNKRVFVYSKGE